MKRLIGVLVLTAAAVVPLAQLDIRAQSNAPKPVAPSTAWPSYGHDPGGKRYSPLTQITPANFGQLQVAWMYHMRPATSAAVAADAARYTDEFAGVARGTEASGAPGCSAATFRGIIGPGG